MISVTTYKKGLPNPFNRRCDMWVEWEKNKNKNNCGTGTIIFNKKDKKDVEVLCENIGTLSLNDEKVFIDVFVMSYEQVHNDVYVGEFEYYGGLIDKLELL